MFDRKTPREMGCDEAAAGLAWGAAAFAGAAAGFAVWAEATPPESISTNARDATRTTLFTTISQTPERLCLTLAMPLVSSPSAQDDIVTLI
ncbi:MAG TPA: hypothetical protein VGE68_07315 [Sphingomicrobium sp.]